MSSRGNAEGSVETVCTRLRVGLHERSSSARSCGAVRANMLSISEATSGWYWKTATWLGSGWGSGWGLGLGLGLGLGFQLGLGLELGSGLGLGLGLGWYWRTVTCEESSLTT